jgi:ferric-dicitrate binding protein FerR (iron transport regulator)
MNEERFSYLLDQYVTGTLQQREQQEFFAMLEEPAYRDMLGKKLETDWLQDQYEDTANEQVGRLIEQYVLKRITYEQPLLLRPRSRVIYMRRAVAVAVVLCILAGAGYFLLPFNKKEKTTADTTATMKVIPPGGNKAILTLADNSTIMLDSAANGTLAKQGSSVVNKTKDGELKYEAGNERSEVAYNTLSTPRGGQYQLVLPDGSKVWLNAASSITYPTAFVGKERKVTISGEAYFEVAPVKLRSGQKMPFLVQQGDMTVQVLGTHFNVNGYDDEAASMTTLLEGAVRVTKGSSITVLKPGEQAVTAKAGNNISVVNNPDIGEIMAWKNGQFVFNDATIGSIMRQMARWYDVEVVYDATISKHFIANIPRSVPLSELLKLLELTDQVHFKIQGRKITVLQ